MRKFIGYIFISVSLLFSLNIFSQNKPVSEIKDTRFSKIQLDSLISDFVSGYVEIKNRSVDEELAKLVKGSYETTPEYEKRKKNLISEFNTKKKNDIKEYFELKSKFNVTAKVTVDSVHYDADHQVAKIHHLNINIPHNLGVPKLNAYVFPVLKYPLAWRTKEGFGIDLTDVRISRKVAEENDVIGNKGFIEYQFRFFRDGDIPAIRIESIKWIIADKDVWNWSKGHTRIPNGIYNKPLKGQL